MRVAHLAERLEAVPRPEHPRPEWEQVRTPPLVAAELLATAHREGAIADRRVLDLGCGTGIFAWGAQLLGATAVGVDIDPDAVAVARSLRLVEPAPHFHVQDVKDWDPGTWDTVLANPPFGAQRTARHADRAFYACAVQATRPHGSVWFLAQARTERFLAQMADRHGARLDKVGAWQYPLEAYYAHHRETARMLDVGGYRMTWP